MTAIEQSKSARIYHTVAKCNPATNTADKAERTLDLKSLRLHAGANVELVQLPYDDLSPASEEPRYQAIRAE